MRLNRYIATYSDLSRRKADALIDQGEVIVNRKTAHLGMNVEKGDIVIVSGKILKPIKREFINVMLNKPVGYVCSRDGQGSPTVYDLLQNRMQHLNIAGRLDKDSSGLVILTNNGQLLQELTHPSYNKEKIYIVQTEKRLTAEDIKRLRLGVYIGDERLSKIDLKQNLNGEKNTYTVTLQEGRNRQIRRSLESIGHKVISLHRTKLGPYTLGDLKPEQFREL